MSVLSATKAKMPSLFSRKLKGSNNADKTQSASSSRTYTGGGISSSDVDRLDLQSPTPSMADAKLLPRVPSKDDLPGFISASPHPSTAADHPRWHTNQANLGLVASQTGSTPSLPIHSRDNYGSNGSANAAEFGMRSADARLSGSSKSATVPSKTSTFLSTTLGYNLGTNTNGPSRRKLPTSPPSQSLAPRSSSNRMRSPTPSSNGHEYDPYASSYPYGYTVEGWDLQLEADKVVAILEACGQHIRSRGLDEPLLFSSMALDLSPSNVSSLIKSYLEGKSNGGRSLSGKFEEEIKYANPHDLAAVIKWAFARMGRVFAVPVPSSTSKKSDVKEEMVYVQQRGFLDLEVYNSWRDQERRQQYPASAFNDFVVHVAPEHAKLLTTLFSLLSSTASYSLKNGMMPSKLAKHFGVLLFGLPEDETFARTYDAFIRASNACEHLLLAYIRSQSASSVLPPRLAQHVSGYPSMLVLESAIPNKSAKLVPLTQIERTVRLYSPDLIQTACETDLPAGIHCPEWNECRDESEILGKDPQLSDRFRKLVNLRGSNIQGRRLGNKKIKADGSSEDVIAHGSLANKQWDDFLSGGFAAPDASKLAFDLNESVRKNRGAKRDTVQWNDFTRSGFQGDDTLSSALSFDDTLKQEVQNWPSERDQLNAKLRARQQNLPAFNYDTTPRLIASPTLSGSPEGKMGIHPISRFDESFADVWADYMVGSGWSNRDELTHRTANFVVLQYKSRPNASTVGSQSAGSSLSAPTRFQVHSRKDENIPEDARVDAAWFVIQELVPAQYRAELDAVVGGKGRGNAMMRKLTMFRNRKDKSGGTHSNPVSPNLDDGGPEDVFRPGPGGTTKRIMLGEQLTANTSRADAEGKSSFSNANRGDVLGRSDYTPNQVDGPSSDSGNIGGTHVHSRSEGSGYSNQPINPSVSTGSGAGGASKIMSNLRAKSMRVVKSARRGASSPSLASQSAFESPGPDSRGLKPDSAHAQRGDVSNDRSFTSADFETRSITEEGSGSLGQGPVPAGLVGVPQRKSSNNRTNPGTKRDTENRNGDAWVDILVKASSNRMTGQDATFTGSNVTRDANLGVPRLHEDGSNISVSTPRAGHSPLSDSTETFEPGQGGPRSSTPPPVPPTDKPFRHAEGLAGLDEIGSPSSSRTYDQEDTVGNLSLSARGSRSKTPVRDLEDREDNKSPRQGSNGHLDPVAAARAALRSRDAASMAPRPAPAIDTKKLVESLRAGLSPIEAVRASKDPKLTSGNSVGTNAPGASSQPPLTSPIATKPLSTTPTAGGSINHRNPFSSNPVAGRVADVASKFGGKATSPTSSVFTHSTRNKPLPIPNNTDADDVTKVERAVQKPEVDALEQGRVEAATLEDDEIYPEDAVSNFDARERRERELSIDNASLGPVVADKEGVEAQGGGGLMENLSDAAVPHRGSIGSWSWRGGATGSTLDSDYKDNLANDQQEDDIHDQDYPSRFAQPYQPGQPLDNVIEESESVVSGSTTR